MPVLKISDFSGGLRTDKSQNLINDNESPTLQNIWLENTGTLSKRGGFGSEINGADGANGGAVTSSLIAEPSYNSSDIFRLYTHPAGTSTYFHKSDSSLGSLTKVTMPVGESILSNPVRLNNLVVFAGTGTGVGSPGRVYQYDGTTVSTVDSTFGGEQLVVHKDYVFIGPVFTTLAVTDQFTLSSRIRWSAQSSPTSWPTNNWQEFDTNDGFRITALLPFNNALYVLKGPLVYRHVTNTNSGVVGALKLFRFSGETFNPSSVAYSLQNIPFPYETSSVFPRTFKVWNNMAIFLTTSGLFAFDGSQFTNLSEKILPTVISSVNNFFLKRGIILSLGTWHNGVLIPWGTTTTGTSGACYEVLLYTNSGTWLKWRLPFSSATANAMSCLDFKFVSLSTGQALFLIGNDYGQLNDPSIWKYDATSFIDTVNGVNYAILASYTTKEFDSKRTNHFKYAYVDFRSQPSGILNLEYNIDQKGWVMRQVAMGTRVGSIKRSQRLMIGDVGRTIQFRVSNNEPYVNFEVYEIGCEYTPLAEESQSNVAQAVNVNIGDSTYGQP